MGRDVGVIFSAQGDVDVQIAAPYQSDPSILLGPALPTVPDCARHDYPMNNYHINDLAFLCIHAVQTLHVLFSPCQYLRAGTSASHTVPSAVLQPRSQLVCCDKHALVTTPSSIWHGQWGHRNNTVCSGV